MKKLLGLLLCGALSCILTVGTTGCGKKEPAKDTTKDKNKDKDKDKGDKVALGANPAAVTIEPGKKTDVTITVKNHKTDVKLTATAGDGVTASLKPETVEKDKKDATLTVEAKEDAKDATVTVTVKGDKDSASVDVKVTVKKKGVEPPPEKGKVSLEGPKDATTIKQGKEEKVKVAVARTKFDGDVKLEAKVEGPDGKAKGVTAKLSADTAKKADADVTVTIAATDDATEGEWTVTVSGTGKDATVSDTKIKVKVEKK